MLKLLIVATALVALSACEVRPIGSGPGYYYNSNERGYQNRDRGDRDFRGDHEGQEHR
jgi:hypothetical protein